MPKKPWRWTQARLPERKRLKHIFIDSTGGRGYLALFDEVDEATREPVNPTYWAGTAPHLTRYATQKQAQAHAVALPVEGVWTLTDEVECRYIRLYHQAIDEQPYILRDIHPQEEAQDAP